MPNGELAPFKPSGLRRYGQFNAIVEKIAKGFEGQDGVSVSPAQQTQTRRALYGVPRNVIALMDILVAYSRSQDWARARSRVWPRNETLSLKLGVSVRQVQNYVRAAVEHGLLTPATAPMAIVAGCGRPTAKFCGDMVSISAPRRSRAGVRGDCCPRRG
ncbi:hypothetical protein GCM10020258_51240 [Sphingomonas yabuuchiae]